MALTLATNGGRKDGKWAYGAVGATTPNGEDSTRSAWAQNMKGAGLVLDYLGEARLKRVAEGKEARNSTLETGSAW